MKSVRKIKKILIVTGLICAVFALSGCFRKSIEQYSVDLEIWGLFDSSDAYGKAISQYGEMNPFSGDIKYKKLVVDDYKRDLLDALASGNGPDIFLINNAWLPQFKDKIEPMPEWIAGEQEFRAAFPDVVADDFLADGRIYGVPLSVDSLALYYNKDLLNEVGYTEPPSSWDDILEYMRRLKKIDSSGVITRAGISLGTAENINRSSDLLGLLMMQLGAQMNDRDGNPNFNESVTFRGQKIIPGEAALNFYSQFANPENPMNYTWNPRMHYSIDSFYEGISAMMINYSWHMDTIRSKNAKLDFAVAPVPQFEGGKKVNYANYWVFVVAKNKTLKSANGQAVNYGNETRVHEAWQFLRYLTFNNGNKTRLINGKNYLACLQKKDKNCVEDNSKEFALNFDPAADYIQKTGKPGARRDIIEKQKTDPFLNAFVYGNLIAKSWYQKDSDSVEQILADAITNVNRGRETVRDSIELAANRIRSLNK